MTELLDLRAAADFLRHHCHLDIPGDGLEVSYVKRRLDGPVLAVLQGLGTGDAQLSVTARWIDPDKAGRVADRLNAQLAQRRLVGSSRLDPPAAFCAELGILFTAFPTDRRLPSLPEVAHATGLTARFEGLLAASGFRGALADVCARVVRYKPDCKCVFRFDLHWAAAPLDVPRVIYGKVSKPTAFARSRSTLSLLHSHQALTEFALPTPLGCLEDLSLELFTEVAGTQLAQTMMSSPAAKLGTALGLALHGFHDIAVDLPNTRTNHAKAELVMDNGSQLAAALPRLDKQTTALASEIADRLVSADTPLDSVVHHDFHGSNVLVDSGGLGLLDFEDVAMGDRADDLGSMYAHLTELAYTTPKRAHVITSARSAFLHAYGTVSPSRLVTHAGLHCLLRAYQTTRHGGTTAPGLVTLLLGASRRILRGQPL